MILEFGTWLVPVENKEKHLETMDTIYDNLKSKRGKFEGIRSSRFYSTSNGQEPHAERWIYLDAYENAQAYDEVQRAMMDDTVAAYLRAKWETLIVPNSFRTEVWTELHEKLWID
jgi:hypothetical protein